MELASAAGLQFDPGDLDRLGQFLGLLLDANTRFNLTAIRDPEEAWIRHILDSLTLLPYLAAARTHRLIDVGSGGGLPGLPLAIALPAVEVTVVESTGKKARFIEEAAATLGLENVKVVHDRAETIGQDHHLHREHYDMAVCRAVGGLNVLLELCSPLVKVGGHVLSIKGDKAPQEIEASKAALHRLHCHVVETSRTATGTIIVVEKQRKTPRLYPRRPGEPKRAPLA